MRAQFVEGQIDNLHELHFNIQKLTHVLNDISSSAPELDLFNEKANEIVKKTDKKGQEKFKEDSKKINKEWQDLVNGLETGRETLNNVAQHWEKLESQMQTVESNLNKAEEKVKLVDMVGSKSPEDEAKQTLTVSPFSLSGRSN